MLRWINFILKHRGLVLIFLVLLFFGMVPGISRIEVFSDMRKYFLKGDVVLENQVRFEELFNSYEFVGVLFESDDVFSRESLEAIKRIEDTLQESVPFANGAISIVSFDIGFSRKGRFDFKNGKLLTSPEEIAKIKKIYSKSPAMKGRMFSDDGKQAWIILQLTEYPSAEDWLEPGTPQFKVGEVAYKVVHDLTLADGMRVTATGTPVYAQRKEKEMMGDLFRIFIWAALAATFLTIVLLRDLRGILGTFFLIVVSIGVVAGAIGWLKIGLDSAFMAVPILLTIGVSIGYTVHISHFFSSRFYQTGKRKESVVYAITQSGRPILFTVITTVASLLTFLLVRIAPIRLVGLVSACSITMVFFISMTLFPLILSLGKDRDIAKLPKRKGFNPEPLLLKFSLCVKRFAKVIVPLFLFIAGFAVWGISMLKVDFSAEKMMGNKLPHMQDQNHIKESLIASGDYMDLTLVFPTQTLLDPETIHRIELLQKKIEKMESVKKTTSLSLMIKEFNRISHLDNDKLFRIPETKTRMRALFNLSDRIAPEFLRQWIDEDYSTTRVTIELDGFSSRQIEENIKAIEKASNEILPEVTEIFFSGSAYQMAVMNQYITRGLVTSILTALIIITILMIIVFRSFKLGIIGMIPNLFPILICGAIMGFLKIPLEFVTMTVAPMIIGLAVDDTIHFVNAIKVGAKRDGNYEEGINRAFIEVGPAITKTTMILCLVFLVFLISDIRSLVNMGILSSVGMFAAYMADIFITPILIRADFFRTQVLREKLEQIKLLGRWGSENKK